MEDNGETRGLIVVGERLARIETKIDALLTVNADHEERLRALERWRYALPLSALGTVISGLAALYVTFGR